MTVEGRSAGGAGRLLAATIARAFACASRRAPQQDLDELAARAERPSAG